MVMFVLGYLVVILGVFVLTTKDEVGKAVTLLLGWSVVFVILKLLLGT